MIWSKDTILESVFGRLAGDLLKSRAAGQMARRWTAMLRRHPELREDLIQLGGLLKPNPKLMSGGDPGPADKTPYQCGVDDGRRELAVQILALGSMTNTEINRLMEDDDYADRGMD